MKFSWLVLWLVTFLSSDLSFPFTTLFHSLLNEKNHPSPSLISNAFRLSYPSLHNHLMKNRFNTKYVHKQQQFLFPQQEFSQRKVVRIMMNDIQQGEAGPENKIRKQLQQDMFAAMKAKDTIRLNAVRGIIGAIKQVEIDEKIIPDETKCVEIMSKMIRDRKESIKSYEEGGRPDLVAEEQGEIDVISLYMPKQATLEEIQQLIEEIVTKVDAKTIKDIGKVMPDLKKQLLGRADVSQLGELVRKRLTGK